MEIRGLIPLPSEESSDEIESLVLPYGFALLQEITFNFLVYCAADVQSVNLRHALIAEYSQVLNSLINSK